MTPFDFVNSVTYNKTDLFEDPQAEKDYVPFVVNRALSYFPDTVLLANEMNRSSGIPKRWQFDFLRSSIPKRKRFTKWAKKDQSTADLLAVQEYYKYSTERALEAMTILSKEQIQQIKQQMDKGGKS
jgi:hypothetical protein